MTHSSEGLRAPRGADETVYEPKAEGSLDKKPRTGARCWLWTGGEGAGQQENTIGPEASQGSVQEKLGAETVRAERLRWDTARCRRGL